MNRQYIHILDDDSLLNIFYLYRRDLLDEGEANSGAIMEGGRWSGERWWYKLTQVCRKWRLLILGSASYLRLCHLCTYRTPVAEVLAHSPSLPLIIDHMNGDLMNPNDEFGILLALQHRDRLRRIRLHIPLPSLRNIVAAMNDEFPILEFLYIMPTTQYHPNLRLPDTFQGPRLCHLVLKWFAFPIGSPLLATAAGLVTLTLELIYPSVPFHPHNFL